MMSDPAGTEGGPAPDPSELGDAEDERASEPPAEDAEPDPKPGEDEGPLGNPAQDEEALRHSQEERSERKDD